MKRNNVNNIMNITSKDAEVLQSQICWLQLKYISTFG